MGTCVLWECEDGYGTSVPVYFNRCAIRNAPCGVGYGRNTSDTQLAADDGSMAGAAAAVGDHGRGEYRIVAAHK